MSATVLIEHADICTEPVSWSNNPGRSSNLIQSFHFYLFLPVFTWLLRIFTSFLRHFYALLHHYYEELFHYYALLHHYYIISTYYYIIITSLLRHYYILEITLLHHYYIITHVTQERTRHPGFPAVQLWLTCDQICTGSESLLSDM